MNYKKCAMEHVILSFLKPQQFEIFINLTRLVHGIKIHNHESDENIPLGTRLVSVS